MQGTTLWEGSTCPLCDSQGINSKLKFFRLNLRVAALLCKRKKCPFPLSTHYPDTFVRVGRDGKIIPGSQSERGWPHEEEDDSDDSPYISDASEESVTFPDAVPEVKPVHNVSSENTNEKGTLEVDAFDISSIDFETDDSMDTFKLRNEITSLEMEIRKCVENMKSVPLHINFEGSSVLNDNSEKSKNSGSVSAKAFTSSDKTVCTDIHNESDVNGVSCVKMNENGVEWCNDKKSGNIILHEHDSPTSIPGSNEHTKTSQELADCMQQFEVNTPVPNKCISNHKHSDVQNNSNRNFGDGRCSDDDDIDGGLEGVESIHNGSGSDSNVEKQFDMFSVADTSIPEPASSMLTPESIKNTVENGLPRKCELLAELVCSEPVTVKKDNDCEKETCDNKEVIIIFDDHKNTDCRDNNVGRQLDTISMTDTSNAEPEPSVLITPENMKNSVGNGFPRKHELLSELVSTVSATSKKDTNCGKEMCNNKDIDIIFNENENSDVYEIVAIEKNTSPAACLNNSASYEVINLQLRFCENQKSSGDSGRRKTAKLHYGAQNTIEQHGKRSSVVCSVSTASSSVSGEQPKQYKNTFARNNGHSKNCVCFLCTECNTKGITSHLDRALADLFPEEHSIDKQLTERELPTEQEVMRDFVHSMAGNSSIQNIKRSPKKRKRLFHL